MPQSRVGRLLYLFVLALGVLLLGQSLYSKHRPGAAPAFRDDALLPANLELGQAIDDGDLGQVQALLRGKVNLQAPVARYDPEPAVYQAAARGEVEMTQLLLANGADAHTAMNAAVDGLYRGCLWRGTRTSPASYRAILAALQRRGVHLNAVQAVKIKDVAALARAVRAGADLNAVEDDVTPLFVAAADGSVDMVRWLLARGAQVDAGDRWGRTPLMAAAWAENTGTGKYLIELLLKHGADINARSEHGWTPLIYAVTNDFTGWIVETLLEHGAQTELTTQTPVVGRPALTNQGVPLVLPPIRAFGRFGNSNSDTDGDSALKAAARNGNLAAIRALLAHGANINRANQKGITPLLSALYGRHPQAALLLLANGADVKQRSMANDTMLTAAAEICPEVVGTILAHGADVNERAPDTDTALIRAARNGHLDAIQVLLRAGADVNASTTSGWTALMWAAGVIPKAVPLLIASGANVNACNHSGETPLHRAASVNRTVAVQILLVAHANPNAMNNRGQTALQLARRHRHAQAIVDLLLQAGASS